MSTVLSVIQSTCYEINQPAPTSVVNQTDPSILQYINLFYATCRELRQMRWWPQLKRSYTLNLQSGRGNYPLPQDFYASLPRTQWDQGNKWEMLGPMTDREWDYRLYGYITIENRKAYRIFGPDINPYSSRGQFSVNPVPDNTVQGVPLTFEYIMKTWLFPPSWTPGVTYSTGDYVNCGGNIYTSEASGIAGTLPMTMAYGQGQDGGVFWTALITTGWVAGRPHLPGSFVTNGGNLYQCVTGGTSASSGGPTGTGSSITDGTVVWKYCPLITWGVQIPVTYGQFTLINFTYYQCTTPGVQGNNTQLTGTTAPNWNTIAQLDGTLEWDWVQAPYESIKTDNDICLFDDDILIAGIKWRWYKAKGLEWQPTQLEYNNLVDTAMARYQTGRKISLNDNGIMLPIRPNTPEGDYGNL